MNVIRRTIMNQIDNELADDKDSIVRIELTMVEFIRLLKEIVNNYTYIPSNITKICVARENACTIDHLNNVLNNGVLDYPVNVSGSYVVYKGVCIQTHVDYNK